MNQNKVQHTPGLSFDGKGINGPDEYRSRVATFQTDEAAAQYGPLFAAAPDLLADCIAARQWLGSGDGPDDPRNAEIWHRLNSTIARATGKE